ncbi:MAG TPA: rRNA maturation RNase YbeY [Mycobacteriales bacterium]|nr:rRNA maturation RNase YbeY [Mycobacteriales bacterium]
MSIFVANESDWTVDEDALVALARHALEHMGVDPLAELSILLVDVGAMERLNLRWMDEPGPTDVLAFPMDELDDARNRDDHDPSPALLGDIVMCPEVAAAQAKSVGHSLQDEMHLLCTHGVLHLLGYDHAEPEEEQEMFAQQAKLLAAWTSRSIGGATS